MFKSENKIKKNKQDWSYQDDAVLSIEKEIEKNKKSKLLLVIPTGGGKTRTALKVIYKLWQAGILIGDDKVLWVTHLKNLKSQVNDVITIDENKKYSQEELDLIKVVKNILEVELIVPASKKINNSKHKFKLIIIDEAHHTGAESYAVFLSCGLPVLGLTATPVRNDEKMLGYDKIAYQITYRELLKKNIVLKPEFLDIETNTEIDLDKSFDFTNDTKTNKVYNLEKRNEIIAETIFRSKDAYNRVIIFASSIDHVDSLYEVINRKNKFEGELYHVGYIYSKSKNSKTNEKGIDNDEYLKWHKSEKEKKSILINCGILREGYDDPSINTIVLTIPTKSVLCYMQCVGRVVRKNNEDTCEQKTYVLECKDKYVNFIYRIGNEWLFSDLSESLEPQIISPIEVINNTETKNIIYSLMKKHNVEKKYFNLVPENPNPETTSLLFFKSTQGEDYKIWYPLIFEPNNRNIYTSIYNEISENISKYNNINPSFIIFDKLQLEEGDPFFGHKNSAFVNNFVRALSLASEELINKKEIKRIKYYNFFLRKKRRCWLFQLFVVWFRRVRYYINFIKI